LQDMPSRVGSRFDTDVFIVGGGPAGLAAAIAVRKKGFRVTVADGALPPIEKPCGEGMMPEALTALADLGVSFTSDEGFSFRGVSFLQDGQLVSADFPCGRGLGLRRPALHQRLVARAEECGVQFLWQTPVCGIDGDSIQLLRGSIRTKWIVVADGHGSRVRRWSGLARASHNQQRYASRRHYRIAPWSNYMEVYWALHTQAYVTPIAHDQVCVVTMADTAGAAEFGRALCEHPELREKLLHAQLSSRERGAVSSMRSLKYVQRGNVALLGDASGSVDAITGEGLRLAFRQASALADALAVGDLSHYQHAHREIARRPRLMGNLMLWLSRRRQLRARLFRAIQAQPHLFARLVATHVGGVAAAELLSCGVQLGVRLLTV